MTRLLGALLLIVTLHSITNADIKAVGEYIAAFSVKDDTLFYVTQRGDVFKSVDTGISYSPYCSVPADFNVSALLLLGNTFFTGQTIPVFTHQPIREQHGLPGTPGFPTRV